MTPDQSIVASAVLAWKTQLERADKLFSGLGDEQLLKEVAPGKNRLVYLWGFVTQADRTATELPSAAELKRLWDEVNDRLLAGFGAFTAADWAQKHSVVSAQDFAANPLRNRLAILLSRTSHVAYHLGQAQLAPK